MSFDLKLENGSFSFKSGEVVVVNDIEKLKQDVAKIIITELGSVRLHNWYGTTLLGDAIGTSSSRQNLKSEVIRSVSAAMNNLKLIQEQNEKSGQILTSKEVIGSIDDVDCLDTTDPRQVIILVKITTRSGIKMSESLPLFL